MSNWSQFNKPITIQQAIANGTATRLPSGSRVRTPASAVQDSMNRANAANEARYNEALGIYDTMLGNAGQFGQLENQRLNQSVLAQSSNLDQDLFSKGLSNTTIGPSMQAGIQREANFNRTAIADAVARQKNSILEGKAGVIERRQDLGPDLALFSELQRLAAAAPSRGGSGGGNGGYQPSVFGGSFRTPQRSSSSSGKTQQQRSVPTANQSQYQLMLAAQQRNAAATARRQAADEDYRRRVAEAQARQQAAIRQQQQQQQLADNLAYERAAYASDPDYAIYTSLSDGDYDSEYYRQLGYGW